jgi:hypothetical protein
MRSNWFPPKRPNNNTARKPTPVCHCAIIDEIFGAGRRIPSVLALGNLRTIHDRIDPKG